MMLSTGQLLADRYRLTQRIAVGGMGEVWSAEDTRLDRTVAMKILKAELSGDAEFLHRFRTEARTTASLNHQGVAAVHDYGETASSPDGGEDTAYLVMELVEGEPMATLLRRHGRLSVEFTLEVLEQSAQALQAAHENGLVHRDVKPGNIMIAQGRGGEVSVKLTDFGIAKAAHAAPVTRSGMVMGTAHYIAPEQATGSEASPASDVYSLATCGYECLAGRRPFLSDHAVTVAMQHIRDVPPPLPPDVPPPVRQLIEFGMTKDPRQRYSRGGEFAAAVATVRSDGPPPHGYQSGSAPPGSVTSGSVPSGSVPPASAPFASVPTQTVPPGVPYPPTGANYAQPHRRRGPRPWVWILLTVGLIAVIVVVVLLVTRAVAGPATQTAAATSAAEPAGESERQPPTQSPHSQQVTSAPRPHARDGARAGANDERTGRAAVPAKTVLPGGREGKTRLASQFGDDHVTSIQPHRKARSASHVTVLCTPGVGDEDHH